MTLLNPHGRIGFAELSRLVGIGSPLLVAESESNRNYLRGSKISCAELHFVPVLRSLLRRASFIMFKVKIIMRFLISPPVGGFIRNDKSFRVRREKRWRFARRIATSSHYHIFTLSFRSANWRRGISQIYHRNNLIMPNAN